MSEEEARPLVKSYGLRSKAAHGDLITGQPLTTDEFTGGGWFYSSPESQFKGIVREVKHASRRVLESALLGKLPEPEQP